MQIDMSGVIYSLSYALDCIEAELVGVSQDHAKWVAYLATRIGRECALSAQQLSALSACAALHDNALTQYLAEESGRDKKDMRGVHCTLGEENLRAFPFRTDTAGFVLYHHENADGSGPFGKRASEIPLQAHIIHLSDMLDAACRFHDVSAETYAEIRDYLRRERGRLYTAEVIDCFFRAMPEEKYLSLAGENIDDLLSGELPHRMEEYSFEQVKAVMNAFGKIVDYKSHFTRSHSEQIARRVFRMTEYYGFDRPTAERLYVAGALHDIGKMAIANDILEKPGKLTDAEFGRMQNHAWYTYRLLSRIDGFADITRWASFHHEKLNGKGYPFGKTAEELDKKERLMACVDIYQALREDRPYKRGMPHEECVAIMRRMAEGGFIDAEITADIDRVFAQETPRAIAM